MSGKRRIDRDHPDYREYIEKCHDIQKRMIAETDRVDADGWGKYPDWQGRDTPWDDELRSCYQKYEAELRELKKRYAHLFSEDIDNDR